MKNFFFLDRLVTKNYGNRLRLVNESKVNHLEREVGIILEVMLELFNISFPRFDVIYVTFVYAFFSLSRPKFIAGEKQFKT